MPLPLLFNKFARDYPCGFLPSMLQRVQTIVRDHGSLGVIENPKDTAVAAGFSFSSIVFGHVSKVRKK
jgi:hypothetical protein